MDNFISPLMDGLTQAMQIHGMVQHQRDQREAMQRQKFQDARNNRIQDLMLQNSQDDRADRKRTEGNAEQDKYLAMGATPLQNGMSSGTVGAPAQSTGAPLSMRLAGAVSSPAGDDLPEQDQDSVQPGAGPSVSLGVPALDAITAGMGPTKVSIPADPARTRTLAGGQQVQVPTNEQTEQNALQRARAANQLKTDQKRDEEQVKLPDGTTADARGIPITTNKYTVDNENKRSADEIKSREGIADKTQAGDNQRAAGVQAGANQRNAATNATHLEGAKIAAGGRENIFDQRQQANAEKEKGTLEQKSQNLWKQVTANEAAAGVKNGDSFPDPKTGKQTRMNDLLRKKFQTDAATVRGQVAEVDNQATAIRKRYGWGEFAQGGQPAAAPPAAAAPAAAPAKAAPAQAPAGQQVMRQADFNDFVKLHKLTPEAGLAVLKKQNYRVE
jgi:hypothetical protein